MTARPVTDARRRAAIPKPWRIALVDHAPVLGGAEVSLLEIATHLDRTRFDPLVFTPAASPLAPLLRAREVAWHDFSLPRLGITPLALARAARAARDLSRAARARGVAVVLTNTARAHLAGALVRALPVVWMLRDDTVPGWLVRLLARRPAALVANSHWTARRCGLAADARLAVVHPGVDGGACHGDGASFRRRFGIAAGEPLVTHVGRLVRWKGQETFLRAAALVAGAVPAARFAVVGGWSAEDEGRGGGAGYAAELESLCTSLGLDRRCVLTGHESRVADAHAASDVAVHTAIRPEPFGRVLVEAMAAGVPVVAADDGGPREIVEDGVSGVLVPPGDPARLATALIELLGDDARRRALARAGRERAARDFDARIQTGRLAAICERVARNAG